MTLEYENEVPIDDRMVVLDLLAHRWGDGTTREIVRWFEKTISDDHGKPWPGPYVEIGHHADFHDSTIYRFRITTAVADNLLASGDVGGRPKWGYTELHELVISDRGKHWLWSERERLGLHPDLNAASWYERTAGSRARWGAPSP